MAIEDHRQSSHLPISDDRWRAGGNLADAMYIVRIVSLVFNEIQIAGVVDCKLGSPGLQTGDQRRDGICDYIAALIHLVFKDCRGVRRTHIECDAVIANLMIRSTQPTMRGRTMFSLKATGATTWTAIRLMATRCT